MLYTVKIGTVAIDNTAIARVHIEFKFTPKTNLCPDMSRLQAIGRKSPPTAYWLHFTSKAQWNRFFKLWEKLEKPGLLRVNIETNLFYPPKGVK